MSLTKKQTYVLENLDRVKRLPYKVISDGRRPRYQLDGWECTEQITGLSVRKLIKKRDLSLVQVQLLRQNPV